MTIRTLHYRDNPVIDVFDDKTELGKIQPHPAGHWLCWDLRGRQLQVRNWEAAIAALLAAVKR